MEQRKNSSVITPVSGRSMPLLFSIVVFSHPILPDIVFENTSTIEGDGTPLDLVRLCVFETPCSKEPKTFTLIKRSSGLWEMNGFIEIEIGYLSTVESTAETDAISCIVENNEEDFGFVHVDAHGVYSEHGLRQIMETCDTYTELAMSWKCVEIPSERKGGSSDVAALFTYRGVELLESFLQTGDLSYLSEGITMLQQAVEFTPHESFTCRFEYTGELSDIGDAISAGQKAVDLTPHDIDDAISAGQKAVDLTPHGHADLPARLNNLADESRRIVQKALDFTPDGHVYLPAQLSNLGVSFACRFERTGELSDITDAILAQQKAVGLTPQGHADLPAQLINLALSFSARFSSFGSREDLGESLSHYKAAAISTSGPPRVKLDAAIRWARTLIHHHPQSREVLLSFDTALSLITLIAGLEQTVRGRYTQLEGISGLALESAAAACGLDRADKALEWLEQGRCLVWSQLNALRTPLDDLRSHDEELADSIAETARQLETARSSRAQIHASMPLSEKIPLEDEVRAHLNLARKWDDLLRAARAIPGFEFFLMPSPCSLLMQHLPHSGPLIVININDRHCDALALRAGLDEPLHIPLPNFSVEKAGKYRTILDSQLRTHNLCTREVEVISSVDSELLARGIKSAPIGRRTEDPVHRSVGQATGEVPRPFMESGTFRGGKSAKQFPEIKQRDFKVTRLPRSQIQDLKGSSTAVTE
ncbi:hypothetical protein DFP72DRAFT_1098346 [Ephemerocybe angulata]|uniref:CHAT domain-containing protein n=1 Tax=Ephemerocybe angulata TaxID=980116 RepID=A0A8H6HC18_9AGAR|nr:hypothetical protein DFP72DRAFT_1098346 [Tulosesus angulatus]